ncbi:MAG: DUF5777 family beta-barrel protein [Ginsengibacter sp.]
MKRIIQPKRWLPFASLFFICLFLTNGDILAQTDSTAVKDSSSVKDGSAVADSSVEVTDTTIAPSRKKPAKATFQSVWIIDNQTVMVPIKGAMEMDIQHRFGTVNNGTKDLWGLLGAGANIRLGMSYSPINRLNLGIGITKDNMLLDLSAKYAIITQLKGKYPVSITYYGNAADNTKKEVAIYDGSVIAHTSDRYVFFNQLIIARKFSNKLSLQIAPSVSHQNAVSGYYTDTLGKIFKSMKHDHFAFSVAGRYKLTTVTSIIFNYDQPITKHATNNPDPNLSLGFEFNSSGHTFQVFAGNYYYLNPQRNNLYNTNSAFGFNDLSKTHPDRRTDDPATTKDESMRVKGGRFLIGFNITRLWYY